MRISDWSSDVCSSDLPAPVVKPLATEIQTPVTPSHTIQAVTDVTVREIAMSAQIDAYQLEATRAKVEKINARAAKKGLAGTLTMSVEEDRKSTRLNSSH